MHVNTRTVPSRNCKLSCSLFLSTLSGLCLRTNHAFLCAQIYVTQSYDATSHFETTCEDVLDVYKRIAGSQFDFTKLKDKVLTSDEEH